MLVVQVAGLIGTGYIVWVASIAPRLRFGHDSVADIALQSIGYALLAWAWSAVVVLLLFAAVSGEGKASTHAALRVSRTAIWLAPAWLLLTQMSPAAVIPALALVVGTTEMLYAQWITGRPRPTSPLEFRHRGRFELLPERPWLRTFGPPMIASLGLQAGLVAMMMHHPLLAGFLFVSTASMMTLLMLMGGALQAERNVSLPRSAMGIILTVMLAAGLTTVHVLYHRSLGSVSAAGEPGQPANSEEEAKEEPTPLYNAPGTIEINDKVFPGVVISSEVKPYVTLITPPPSWLNTSIASQNAQPYSIPFSGEYWMFKPPQQRPPRGAYTKRGTPLKLFYRTTDRGRMSMEAHQQLDHPIDLNCCRSMQIVGTNADRYPATISLELILIDNRTRKHASLSLGQTPGRAFPKTSAPVTDVLQFRIPSSPRIRSFNEFKVVLHRDPVRIDKSARLAIERFVLVPGM